MYKHADPRGALRAAIVVGFATSSAGLMACPPDAEFEPLAAVWQQAEYDLAALKLSEYRTCPYAKNARVDYMLGSSLCRIDVTRIGVRYFERMLTSYDFSAEDLAVVVQERDRCGLYYEKPAAMRFNGAYATTAAPAGRFDWARPMAPIGSGPATRIRNFETAELQARLFERTAGVDAEAVAARLGVTAEVLATEHLVIVGVGVWSRPELDQFGRALEGLWQDLTRQFQFPEPGSLITVYVVADQPGLRSLAEAVHGLRIPSAAVGYYYVDDLSVAGIVQDGDLATLQHELFHLVARNDFGDIPPWLDEGLAALFESSRPRDANHLGVSNWREAILDELWAKRPQLGELLRMDRAAFQADGNSDAQLVNYAMVRYLMLYLQEMGQLVSVYREIRANDAHDIQLGSGTDAVRDLERLTGKAVDALDEAFATWFRSLAPPRDTDTVRMLQTRLNALGLDAGLVDGIYGPRTAGALARFQRSVGLKPAGYADRATIDALDGAVERLR